MIDPALFRKDEARHIYTLGRLILPSVTTILGELGLISDFYTEEGRIRGQAVHMACQYLDEGVLDWESLKATEDALSQPIGAYVKGWRRFCKDTGFKPRLIEVPFYHPDHLYAGTPDRVGTFPGDKYETILDLKTGAVPKWTALQTAGYDEIVPRLDGRYRRRAAVQLTADGDFKPPVLFDDLNDGRTFLNYAAAHRWGRKNGYYKPVDANSGFQGAAATV